MKQVTAAIIIQDGKVLLAQRRVEDKLSLKWEFPGGKIEMGETPEECIVREIMEELNLKVEVAGHFTDSVYEYASGTVELKCYLAKILAGKMELHVHADACWVDPQDLLLYDLAPADIAVAKKLKREF